MNRLIFAFFLLIFSFGSAQDLDSTRQNAYEHILSFHSDIVISKDAEVTVTEKIKVYAAGIDIRRGIFRSLPRWRNINDKKVRIKYDVISVRRDGAKEDHHTENTNSDLAIYFGKKDHILTPGFYEYELTYKTSNQIGFFENYDEFYWNVNGTLWNFKVDQVSAKVTLPNGAEITQNSCYTGAYGAKEALCSVNQLSPNSIAWTSENLQENEGLTIAVGFKKGVFAPPPPPGFLEKYGIFTLLLLSALLLSTYFYNTWSKYGVDPEKPVIYPQFNAPQKLSPASLGFLKREYYTDKMITAAIVNLAVKGYIKIIEDDKRVLGIFGGKEYTLNRLAKPDQLLPQEEINLMNMLFPEESASIAFTGKYDSKIENAVKDFKASLDFQHQKFLQNGNNSKKLFLPAFAILALYAAGLFVSFKLSYNNVFLGIGIVYGIVSVVFALILSFAFSRFKLMKWVFVFISIVFGIILVAIMLNDSNLRANLNFYASFLFLYFGFVCFVFYQHLIKQPTPEKLETQSLIDGFKMYLGMAEEKTLQFHNSPKLTPEVFEKMLPYAMVLGVEQIWGEKFQNMLKNSALGGQQYQSSWFIGHSMMSMNFASSLNSSLSQSIASSSTQPSSSGSGSGGGGFSGGGGGGGGGGGW